MFRGAILICLPIFLAAYLLACANSNGSPESDRSTQIPDPSQVPKIDDTIPANDDVGESDTLLVKRSGWFKFDKEDGTVKLVRTELEGQGGVYSSLVVPREELSFRLTCDQQWNGEKDGGRCGKFPFKEEWTVQEVNIVDFKGTPFCYKVSAFRGQHRGLNLFAFYDMDGDGTFETFDLGGYFDLRIPPRFTKAKER